MTLTAIKSKAKDMGIKTGKLTKVELIQRIQENEGNFPCFGTSTGSCEQMDCSWRSDCLK